MDFRQGYGLGADERADLWCGRPGRYARKRIIVAHLLSLTSPAAYSHQHVRLGMSALAGDPDLYSWVFGCQMSHPDLRRSFPMDYPELWVKNPWVNRYPQVLPMVDPRGYSQVYPWVPASRSEENHRFHTSFVANYPNQLLCYHQTQSRHFLLLFQTFVLILK